MHIYTDWSGWGATEVLENAVSFIFDLSPGLHHKWLFGSSLIYGVRDAEDVPCESGRRRHYLQPMIQYHCTDTLHSQLADFNKNLFKKNVSPLQKWSHLEGIVTWLKLGDLFALIGKF
jgi:hypothetical protein